MTPVYNMHKICHLFLFLKQRVVLSFCQRKGCQVACQTVAVLFMVTTLVLGIQFSFSLAPFFKRQQLLMSCDRWVVIQTILIYGSKTFRQRQRYIFTFTKRIRMSNFSATSAAIGQQQRACNWSVVVSGPHSHVMRFIYCCRPPRIIANLAEGFLDCCCCCGRCVAGHLEWNSK